MTRTSCHFRVDPNRTLDVRRRDAPRPRSVGRASSQCAALEIGSKRSVSSGRSLDRIRPQRHDDQTVEAGAFRGVVSDVRDAVPSTRSAIARTLAILARRRRRADTTTKQTSPDLASPRKRRAEWLPVLLLVLAWPSAAVHAQPQSVTIPLQMSIRRAVTSSAFPSASMPAHPSPTCSIQARACSTPHSTPPPGMASGRLFPTPRCPTAQESTTATAPESASPATSCRCRRSASTRQAPRRAVRRRRVSAPVPGTRSTPTSSQPFPANPTNTFPATSRAAAHRRTSARSTACSAPATSPLWSAPARPLAAYWARRSSPA